MLLIRSFLRVEKELLYVLSVVAGCYTAFVEYGRSQSPEFMYMDYMARVMRVVKIAGGLGRPPSIPPHHRTGDRISIYACI